MGGIQADNGVESNLSDVTGSLDTQTVSFRGTSVCRSQAKER